MFVNHLINLNAIFLKEKKTDLKDSQYFTHIEGDNTLKPTKNNVRNFDSF